MPLSGASRLNLRGEKQSLYVRNLTGTVIQLKHAAIAHLCLTTIVLPR